MKPRSDTFDADHLPRAFFWIVLSSLSFAFMGFSIRRLSATVPHFELVFFRSFISLLITLPIILKAARSGESLFPEGKSLLIFRGIAGFGGIACLFYATFHLPLAVASILNWSSLIFVILISHFFLKERVTWTALGWVAVAVSGLFLLVKAGGSSHPLPLKAVGIGLLGALCSSLAVTAVRAATARFGSILIIFYLSWVSALIAAPLAFQDFYFPQTLEWIEILAMGGVGTLAQFAMTQGYRAASAWIVTTLNLMTSAFSALIGRWVFQEDLSSLQWLGMAVLAAGVVMSTLAGQRR